MNWSANIFGTTSNGCAGRELSRQHPLKAGALLWHTFFQIWNDSYCAAFAAGFEFFEPSCESHQVAAPETADAASVVCMHFFVRCLQFGRKKKKLRWQSLSSCDDLRLNDLNADGIARFDGRSMGKGCQLKAVGLKLHAGRSRRVP